MMACWDALEQQFGTDIEIRPTFVRFFGQKYTAIDFAAARVRIGGTEFDIDAAVAANPEFEENPTPRVKYGGRVFTGCRRRGRGRGRGRGGAGRGRGGGVGSLPETRSRAARNPPDYLPPSVTTANTAIRDRPTPPTNFSEALPSRTTQNNDTATGFGGNSNYTRPTASHQGREGPHASRPSNYLPPMSGTSNGGVSYFVNAGKHGSTKISNRMGAQPERYAPYQVWSSI
jgi:hypothetical protein